MAETLFSHLDVLTVAITVAAISILGFVVFFNDRTSITNKSFLGLALAGSAWSITNYLSYQFSSPALLIWLFRFVLFFALGYTFMLFQFFYVFPLKKMRWPKWYTRGLLPFLFFAELLTLSPYTFTGLEALRTAGTVSVAQPGIGMAVFGILILFDIVGAFVVLAGKLRHAPQGERAAYALVLAGAIITFTCHIIFNFILPVFFNATQFLQFGGVLVIPLIAFTTYAIVRHHLLNIKVFAAEALTFFLAIVTFGQVIIATKIITIIFQVVAFILVLIFGILLIQSVQREVDQREELERLNKKIEADKEELEELSRFKSQLLSLASHQIRSPLAAIKGFIALIQGGAYGEVNDKVKETLGKVQNSADDLIGLINTLLDVRKVEEGKMEYTFAKEDLVPLVKGIVDGIQPLAMAKKLELTAELPAATVMASIDHEKFKQVVQNLVDNAIKYTPSGFVRASLAVSGGKISINVSDSGLGIPADLVPHLFEEFIRDERVKKEIRGTGLGLYIARKITEAHGGTLTAASPGEGKGSAFTATIPLAA